MITQEKIEELRALLKDAERPEMVADVDCFDEQGWVACLSDKAVSVLFIDDDVPNLSPNGSAVHATKAMKVARLCAAAANALPALLDAIEEVPRVLSQMKAHYLLNPNVAPMLDEVADRLGIERGQAATSGVDFEFSVALVSCVKEIEAEDDAKEVGFRKTSEAGRIPPQDPGHLCGVMCDGQDGHRSDCARLPAKPSPK